MISYFDYLEAASCVAVGLKNAKSLAEKDDVIVKVSSRKYAIFRGWQAQALIPSWAEVIL